MSRVSIGLIYRVLVCFTVAAVWGCRGGVASIDDDVIVARDADAGSFVVVFSDADTSDADTSDADTSDADTSDADTSDAGTSDARTPPDRDGDGFPDAWESEYGLNPDVPDDPEGDEDGDGLGLAEEYQCGTDPTRADSDGDGLPDGFEVQGGADPLDSADAGADPDGDGLSTLTEYHNGTDPWTFDKVPLAGSEPTEVHGRFAPDGSSVTLTWVDNSLQELGFEVERREDGGPWEDRAEAPRNASSWVDESVASGHTYVYRLAAFNDDERTGFSEIVTVVVPQASSTTVTFLPRIGDPDGEIGIGQLLAPEFLSYTVPRGSARVVLFGASYEQNTDGVLDKKNYTADGQTRIDKTVSDVHYGGVRLHRLGYVKTVRKEDGHNNHLEMWYLLEDDLSQTTSSSWSVEFFEQIDDLEDFRAFVSTWEFVDQVNPFVDVQTNVVSGPGPFITATVDAVSGGAVVVQTVAGNNGPTRWPADVRELITVDDFAGVCASAAAWMQTPNGSLSITPEVADAGTERRAIIAASLRPAPAL